MRLESLRIRNLGPFRDFAVDISTLQGPLVAVCGENGAGKSTMLELALPGALYRHTPTRGSLVDLATARDASLEVRVSHDGSAFTLRHLVDSVSKKSEAVVLDAVGATVLPDTKVRSMDTWAAKHLPAPETLFSCMFAAQGAGGFLAAKPSERKAILLRILGVERLEAMAGIAREKQREAKAALELALTRLTDERSRGGDLMTALEECDHAEWMVDETAKAVALARAALTNARTSAEEYRAKVAARAQLDAQLTELQGRIDALSTQRGDLENRIANNRKILDDAEQIRTAEARAGVLSDELRAAEALATELLTKANADDAEIVQLCTQAGAAGDAADRAQARVEQARQRLRDEQLVLDAVAKVDRLRADNADAQRALDALTNQLTEIQATRLAGAEERIVGLREGLHCIAFDAAPPVSTATAALSADDAVVRAVQELPRLLQALETAISNVRVDALKAQRDLDTAERLAAREGEMVAASAELATAEREQGDHSARWQALMDQALQLRPSEQQIRTEHAAANQQAEALRAEQEGLQPLLKGVAPLAVAEAKIAERSSQLDACNAELLTLTERHRELATSREPVPTRAPDVASAEKILVDAEAAALKAHSDFAVTSQRAEQARQSQERIAGLEAARAVAEAELADWNRLAGDLGKDGLQALEIDAAGPELTALCNDLLHSCHGPRFTVRVDTQRLASDGKRMLEGCDVIVLDTERGREAEGSTFSGGERVIIGEALSLALTMLACRRAGLEGVTLVRDESGAALSPINTRVYIAMLRHAARVVKADKVLFVSHNQEAQDLADSKIVVEPQLRHIAEAAE